MILQKLVKQGLIHCPKWLPDNTAYLTITGSMAYGVSADASDEDIIGFCLPPKDMVFPHLNGHIIGFGTKPEIFSDWQQHHIKTEDGRKEYDFSVYSIVRYFQLCMENNPNMIDSMFTPERCVKHSTEIGRMVRDRRRLFLHKGAWHKFKGYAYGQVHKMDIKRQDIPEVVALRAYAAENGIVTTDDWNQIENVIHAQHPLQGVEAAEWKRLCDAVKAKGKRVVDIARFGYDVKFAYHVVRLLSEVEQIMMEGDLNLERNREQLKSIRRGEWTKEQIVEHFETREKGLEQLYLDSKLPHGPDEPAIKQLLIDCLELHYGSISTAIARDSSIEMVLRDMKEVMDRYS